MEKQDTRETSDGILRGGDTYKDLLLKGIGLFFELPATKETREEWEGLLEIVKKEDRPSQLFMMWQTFREVLAEEMHVPLDKGFNVKKDGVTKHYSSIEALISDQEVANGRDL